MKEKVKKQIEFKLAESLGYRADYDWNKVGGGSINQTYQLKSAEDSFFIKVNNKSIFNNGFIEEVKGLQFLADFGVRTPKIICYGESENTIYLVLNWANCYAETPDFWTNFGVQLANLHRNTNTKFGLNHDNFMGQLAQKNTFCDNFIEFFVQYRLIPQVSLAFNKKLLTEKHLVQFEHLYTNLYNRIPTEPPAVLHGDLWSGNFICGSKDQAWFIDPAVYFGHREVDLAMTTLFGGFSTIFYQSYHDSFPLEPGFSERAGFYNLYPLLVHLNLFGSAYLNSIERIVSQI